MHLKRGIPSRDMLVSSIRHSQTHNNSCERLFGIFQRITELILNELLILTHSDNFSWLGHPHVAIVQTRDNLQWDLFDQVTWKSCWKSCWLAAVVHFVYAGQCCNSFQVRAFNVYWCDWSTCMARCSFDKIRVIFRGRSKRLQYYIQSALSVKIFLSAEDNDHDQNEENDDGQRGNSKLCCQIFLLILQCFIQFWLTPTHPVESSFGQRLKFQTET